MLERISDRPLKLNEEEAEQKHPGQVCADRPKNLVTLVSKMHETPQKASGLAFAFPQLAGNPFIV